MGLTFFNAERAKQAKKVALEKNISTSPAQSGVEVEIVKEEIKEIPIATDTKEKEEKKIVDEINLNDVKPKKKKKK